MFATLDQERHSRGGSRERPIVQFAPCSATRPCRQKRQTLDAWRFADRGKSQRQRDDACEILSFAVAFPVLFKPDGPLMSDQDRAPLNHPPLEGMPHAMRLRASWTTRCSF
jgi:hypothetical protein